MIVHHRHAVRFALALMLLCAPLLAQNRLPEPGEKPFAKPGCHVDRTNGTVTVPRLSVDPSRVNSAYVYGFSRITAYDLSMNFRQAAVIPDPNRTGSVQFTDAEVYPQSLWLAVDGLTADYTVSAPDGFLTRLTTFPANAFVTDPSNPNAIAKIVWSRPAFEVVVVRPGVALWSGRFQDGHDSDSDGVVDGIIAADISKLTPLDSTMPPPTLITGDIVLVIDSRTFEYYATQK